jgi:hypothetical protein
MLAPVRNLFLVLLAFPSFALAQVRPSQPPPTLVDNEQVIAYWTTETGWKSELQLRNNKVAGDLTVTPALRLPDGSETVLVSVTIKPQEVTAIDLDAAIGNTAPRLVGTYGSVVLRFHSSSRGNLYAALMVRNIGHPFAFHIDASGERQDYQTASREGVWWLPQETTSDYLIFTNQGQDVIPLNLSLYDAAGKEAKQKLVLGPRETSRYSVRKLVQAAGLSGSYGGVKIFANAHAGSLDTIHVLFDETAGFSAILKMFGHEPNAKLEERDFARTGTWTLRAPMLALSNPDPALGFPVGTILQPQLFIRNTADQPANAKVRFNWRSGNATGASPGLSLRLDPQETRRIDVAALQDGTTLPKLVNWTSVTLTTEGLPDEVMAVAASYDQTLRFGAQTPFSDQLAHKWAGGMWEFDAQHNSIITAGNGGTQPIRAAFTIFYNQGLEKYQSEQALQPDEQMWIDIGKLIREQVPDETGKTLPRDLTSGSYEVSDLTHAAMGTLFEGKVIYDKTYGHVAYGCALCCAYTNPVLFFNPIAVGLGLASADGVNALETCGDYNVDVSSSFYNNWSSANTAIVTVDSKGNHTGQSVGSTTSQTHGYLEYFTAPPACPGRLRTPSGGANVIKLQVQGNPYNSIFVGTDSHLSAANSIFATVSPPGGTFTTKSSDSKDSFAPVTSGGPGWIITTPDQSQNNSDRILTFSYTVTGEGTVFQIMRVTAREFAYATNSSLTNQCRLGYGYDYDITYTPYTHPDKTAVQPNIGVTDTIVTETFSPSVINCGNVTGDGALNASSQFTDRIALCSTNPLPACTSTNTQTWKVGGYLVRTNSLTIANTGLTYTNQGPTQ